MAAFFYKQQDSSLWDASGMAGKSHSGRKQPYDHVFIKSHTTPLRDNSCVCNGLPYTQSEEDKGKHQKGLLGVGGGGGYLLG